MFFNQYFFELICIGDILHLPGAMACDVGELAEGEEGYFWFIWIHDHCIVEGSEVSQPVPEGRKRRNGGRAEKAKGAKEAKEA